MHTLKRIVDGNDRMKSFLLPYWLHLQEMRGWQLAMKVRDSFQFPRKTHAFCIGLPKSGTHSIARMLDCRTAHEPETQILLHLHERGLANRLTTDEQARALHARDAWLDLELESNWMLGLVLDALVKAFPRARFILTVRDPIPWIESEINQEYIIGQTEPYASAFGRMFGKFPHTEHESALRELGLYSIDGYLSYWSSYHERVLNIVPSDQLLTVATSSISQRADEICEFVGAGGVHRHETHAYSRKEKPLRLRELIDQAYLQTKSEEWTRETRARLDEYLASPSY